MHRLLSSRPLRTCLVASAAAAVVAGLLPGGLAQATHSDPRIVEPALSEAPPTQDGSGNFRIQCGVSHHAADDPVVRPGQPGGSHMHSFAGNTAVDAYTTAESIRTTGESTCHGSTLNRSGYWIPTIYDADGRILRQDPWHVYYKDGFVDAASIRPMPQGLRMVAGDARATTNQPLSVIRFACGTTPIRRSEDFSSTMPACTEGDFVIFSVMFPQCWNGRDLDSADHKSHMAYPIHTGAPRLVCPSTHPVALPAITINLHQVVREARGSGGWRLSSDLPGGAGGQTLHADWFDGWDRTTVSTFVTHCINQQRDCAGGNLGNNTNLVWFQDGAGEPRVTTPRPEPSTSTSPAPTPSVSSSPTPSPTASSPRPARRCSWVMTKKGSRQRIRLCTTLVRPMSR